MSIDTATKLLLQCEGDESSWKHEVKFHGNSGNMLKPDGSKFGHGSFYCGGSVAFVPPSSKWDFSSGDWTIEMFVYRTSGSLNNYFWSYGDGEWNNYNLRMEFDTAKMVVSGRDSGGNGYTLESGGSSIPSSVWTHVCLERYNGVIRLFVGGSIEDSITENVRYTSTYSIILGGYGEAYPAKGLYMDEIRISDIARYQGTAFTPPTEQFESDDNTSFLCHCESDLSASRHTTTTVSPSDNLKVTATQSKFHGALYLNGNNYLTLPNSTDFLIGDYYTVDCWLYLEGNRDHILFLGRKGSDSPCISLCPYKDDYLDNGYVRHSDGSTKSNWVHSNPTLETWFHYAFVKNGDDITIYIDGTAVATSDMNGADAYTASEGGTIGYAVSGDSLVGYIDEFRISDVARWTSNFTPPDTDWTRFGYGYSGNTSAETRLVTLEESSYQVLDDRIVQAGDYSINLGTTNDLVIIGQPTDNSLEPTTHAGVTPVIV